MAVTLMLAIALAVGIVAASPLGASNRQSCDGERTLRPVVMQVPANGRISFGVQDLIADSTASTTCELPDAVDAFLDSLAASSGTVSIRASTTDINRASGMVMSNQFEFVPNPGFHGISRGWQFAIQGQTSASRIGVVAVTFQVRNSLPVARNESVTMASIRGETVVEAGQGVLANDFDRNGDALVVYSSGVKHFPWGLVEFRPDGSYRIVVDDPSRVADANIRYEVWDQRGSPTSIDSGYLRVTFQEHGAGRHADAHRPPTAPDAP